MRLLEAEGKMPEAITILKGILDSTAKKSYDPADNGYTLDDARAARDAVSE